MTSTVTADTPYLYPVLEGPGINIGVYASEDTEAEPVGNVEFSLDSLVDELMAQVANEDGAITAEDDREYALDIAMALREASNRVIVALNLGRQ